MIYNVELLFTAGHPQGGFSLMSSRKASGGKVGKDAEGLKIDARRVSIFRPEVHRRCTAQSGTCQT